MATPPTHQFDLQLSPARRTTAIRQTGSGAVCSAWMLAGECQISGWLLPANESTVHGLRAVSGKREIVARRKQLRPDVYFHHPEHPEALKSGFRLSIPLSVGHHAWQLQFKDSTGKWENFCSLRLWLPPFWRLMRKWLRREATSDYETWCREADKREAQRARDVLQKIAAGPQKPLISVLLPVYNTPEKWLRRALASVREQSYPHWELCIADDHSTEPHVTAVLQAAASQDKRIKFVTLPENGHICRASNRALELCSGEFTVLLDHDDELPPHALLRVAEEILAHPGANLIFSDEDKIDEHGVRSDPYFKPGVNLELLHRENVICHLGVYRTSLLQELGGFRPGFEGAQDWDLALRFTEAIAASTIRHIPQVLYHWRTLDTSTAASKEAKPYAQGAGWRAVQEHLQRTAPGAVLEAPDNGPFRIRWPLPQPAPKVSIIIPTRDRLDLLRVAVDSLFARTEYPSFELIVVDHASEQSETFAYLDHIKSAHGVKILRAEGEFNWSRLNNLGATQAGGELLLFLNNDVEVIQPDWLGDLAAHVCRPGAGAVGARLLYPNGSLQHAGVALRLLGMAGHPFQGLEPGASTMAGHPSAPREVTAVTGACLMVQREVFDRAGGFDEEHLPISYNDVDFCLRLRSLGLHNLYAANAVLVHHESASRHTLEKESVRKAAATAEAQIMLKRWPQEFAGDAFYNPNLSLLSTMPALDLTAAE